MQIDRLPLLLSASRLALGPCFAIFALRLGAEGFAGHADTALRAGPLAIALFAAASDFLELLAGLWPAAISGDVPSVGMALRVAERRARLLGLDAPTRQELTGADGGPLSFVEVATAWARDRVTA